MGDPTEPLRLTHAWHAPRLPRRSADAAPLALLRPHARRLAPAAPAAPIPAPAAGTYYLRSSGGKEDDGDRAWLLLFPENLHFFLWLCIQLSLSVAVVNLTPGASARVSSTNARFYLLNCVLYCTACTHARTQRGRSMVQRHLSSSAAGCCRAPSHRSLRSTYTSQRCCSGSMSTRASSARRDNELCFEHTIQEGSEACDMKKRAKRELEMR